MNKNRESFSESRMMRMPYIDAIKGVGILCITLLHFEDGIFPQWLNAWIGAFMVSLFYFSAGWVSGANGKFYTAEEIFKKRFRQLGVPYFWFSIFLLLFDLLFFAVGWYEGRVVLRDLYKTLVFRGIGTLWFLPVLLFSETLFWMVRSHKRPWIVGLLLFLISAVTFFFYQRCSELLHRGILYAFLEAPIRQIVYTLVAWPIVAIGYFFGARFLSLRWNRCRMVFTGIGILIFSLVIHFLPDVMILSSLLEGVLPELGMVFLFFVCQNTVFSRFFKYWGKNSLILMCLHYSIAMELCLMIDRLVFHRPQFTGWPTLVYFLISVFVIWLLIPLFHGRLNFMLKPQLRKRP